jgi:enamine deaminase RidA (YjgF/YER057c/UK114 family)
VVALLGFSEDAAQATGFSNALREIAPLPDGYKVGDVLRAYLAYMVARDRRDGDSMEPVAGWIYDAMKQALDAVHAACRDAGCPQGADVSEWLRERLKNHRV